MWGSDARSPLPRPADRYGPALTGRPPPLTADRPSHSFALPPVGADQHRRGDDAVLDPPTPVQRRGQGRIGEQQTGGESALGGGGSLGPVAASWTVGAMERQIR